MTSHNAREPVEAIPGEITKTARDLVGDYLDISDRRAAQLAKLVAQAIHDAVMAERADIFERLQVAYRRGVDFACESLSIPDDEYVGLWEFVPKAAYDYADKSTSPKTEG